MKNKITILAAAALAAVGLSSCVVHDYPLYTSASVGVSGNGWSTSVAWTDARYDVNGFPIFGYSYGQPVYGYTSSGVAVFSFAALTSSCCVPSWAPASWYCGHWHYPRHIHRVSCPPRFPAGHHPGRKPAVVHKPHFNNHVSRPAINHRPAVQHKPQFNQPGRPAINHRPAVQHKPQVTQRPPAQLKPQQRPGGHTSSVRPAAPVRPSVGKLNTPQQRPQFQRPQMNRPQMQNSQLSRPQIQRPQVNQAAMSRPQAAARPAMQRPAVQRSAAVQRPSGGGGRPGGHAGHRR